MYCTYINGCMTLYVRTFYVNCKSAITSFAPFHRRLGPSRRRSLQRRRSRELLLLLRLHLLLFHTSCTNHRRLRVHLRCYHSYVITDLVLDRVPLSPTRACLLQRTDGKRFRAFRPFKRLSDFRRLQPAQRDSGRRLKPLDGANGKLRLCSLTCSTF